MINAHLNTFIFQTFDIPDIDNIYVKELEPNGYVKVMISKTNGTIASFYNKDGLLINQDVSKVIDDKQIIHLKCPERPPLYDKVYSTWAPFRIDNLKAELEETTHKKDGYLVIIQQQAEMLKEHEKLATASNNIKNNNDIKSEVMNNVNNENLSKM